jgi:alanyl aminopeptidase
LKVHAFIGSIVLVLAAAAQARAEAPGLRLGDAVRPVRYAADLTVVPSEETFSGTVDIDLDVRRETPVIWLNATELTVREAVLTSGGKAAPARVVQGNKDVVGFATGSPVRAGPARLRVAYEGRLNAVDTEALFRQKYGDDWYVFTQFEDIFARRAFPCFDEPAFKAPWRLTIHARREHAVFSNTPELSTTEEPDGMKAVRFAETKPMPSYLVALAVGPFDVVDAGRAGKNRTPVRIITPRGQGAQAAYAAKVTPAILEVLEDYFGTPYPYEKLDSVAIPITVNFGAMENAGLITYQSALILGDPARDTLQRQRDYASVCAHEIAHQWFGNLVTMAWWDDLWLNEGFANWMENKVVDRLKPEWNALVWEAHSRAKVMKLDSLVTTRRVRQPIESKHDIANAWDPITYDKGAAILRMFEAYLGPETFRKGVRRYLAKHAWGNATTADFLRALSAEAGRDIGPAVLSFTDQIGIPLVTVELQCGNGAPRLVFSQERYLPSGSKGSGGQTWQVPICVRYGANGAEGRECLLMTGTTAEMTLPLARGCPDWVLPNAGEVGYYRVRFRGGLLPALLKAGRERLTLAERVGLVDDIRALTRSGDLPMGEALALVPELLEDRSPEVVSAVVDLHADADGTIVDGALRPQYARFIRATYGPLARELGWRPKSSEGEATRLLRPKLLGLVAGEGEDEALAAEAGRLARRWLDDPSALEPDIVESVLRVAATDGDRALFDRVRAEAVRSRDDARRRALLTALGAFRDPELLKAAFALVLGDQLDPRESVEIVWEASRHAGSRRLAYEFVKANFDALAARLPRDYPGTFPAVGEAICEPGHRTDLEAFFEDRAPRFAGGPRNLAQALESVDLCVAMREAHRASVSEFLKRY